MIPLLVGELHLDHLAPILLSHIPIFFTWCCSMAGAESCGMKAHECARLETTKKGAAAMPTQMAKGTLHMAEPCQYRLKGRLSSYMIEAMLRLPGSVFFHHDSDRPRCRTWSCS